MLEELKATKEKYRDVCGDFSPEEWLSVPENRMYHKDGNVAMFTHEYPGVYSGHWFFEVRGRAALNLAHEWLKDFFSTSDAQAIRGLVRMDLLGSRWAARQIGMRSYGVIKINDKHYELFCMTKKEYLNG